jgi:hypothetical protein
MLVKKCENPDTLSGPSSSCFPHSGHKQEEKYPAVLISMEYPFPGIRFPGAKFLNLQNHFPLPVPMHCRDFTMMEHREFAV